MEPAWAQAVEVESLRVTVIVDNITDMLSPPCDCCRATPAACTYSSEVAKGIAAVKAGKAPCFDFSTSLLAGEVPTIGETAGWDRQGQNTASKPSPPDPSQRTAPCQQTALLLRVGVEGYRQLTPKHLAAKLSGQSKAKGGMGPLNTPAVPICTTLQGTGSRCC